MTPLIGIPVGHSNITSTEGEERANALYVAYSRVVRETGGIPVVPVPTDTPEISALVDRLDGPITTGGGDMGPAPHGSDTHKSVFAVDPEPDASETALAGEFAAGRLPTPAICPGLQVINVALGGTLIVNITAIWTGLDEGTPLERTVRVRSGRCHRVHGVPHRAGW